MKSEKIRYKKGFPSIACDGGDADAGLGIQLGWLMNSGNVTLKATPPIS
jgi:hypothetical protein